MSYLGEKVLERQRKERERRREELRKKLEEERARKEEVNKKRRELIEAGVNVSGLSDEEIKRRYAQVKNELVDFIAERRHLSPKQRKVLEEQEIEPLLIGKVKLIEEERKKRKKKVEKEVQTLDELFK